MLSSNRKRRRANFVMHGAFSTFGQESTAMVENKEEQIFASMPEWSIVLDNTYTQTLRPNKRLDRKKKWSTNLVEILKKKRFLPVWNKIFLLMCVIAITLDPLFFYIPMIDEDKKCIKMDKKLKLSAVILRSLMDTVYIIDIICNAAKVFRVAQRFSYWSLIFVDILAILPVPQVIIFVFHHGLEASGSSSKKWLNAILLSQYIPRIFRIYLSCMELTWTRDKVTRIVWVKGGLNFFLYILASHVFGSFWYFYSFLRETSCWQRACRDNMEELCDQSGSHICDKISESRNITHLNLYCPINPPNATMFDFGIFLGALQSGVLGSNDFPEKFFNCFWWGLRNLSSLGQNLETSNYIWENCFAIAISIIGLLLFLYLIGNLQTYMQLATTKSEEIGEKMKLKERDIELWLEINGLPKEKKTLIMQKVKNKLEQNKDVDVENLLSILPSEERKSIKRLLCLPMLKKIPMFQHMKDDDQLLEVICDHLKPVIYPESSYMIREGDPLDRMLIITQGTAWAYTNNSVHNDNINNNISNNGAQSSINSPNSMSASSSSNNKRRSSSTRRLKKCDYFGEELLEWSMTHITISDFPISTINVKSHTKVEAFALMANDLMNAVHKKWWLFRRNLPPNSADSQANGQRWESSALSAFRTFRDGNKKKKPINSSAAQLAEDGAKYQSSKYRRLRK